MSKSAGLLPIFSTFLPYFGAAAENFGTVCLISAQPPQNLGATTANLGAATANLGAAAAKKANPPETSEFASCKNGRVDWI